MTFIVVAAFLVGACVGSFLNVVIYRLPREESIVRPGSRCPACGRAIRPWENIPVASFLLLRGRCGGCGGRISWRYPAVEALTGAGYAFFAAVDLILPGGGGGFALARDLVFLSLLVPITFIDIDHWIIPHELSLGGLVAGIVLAFLPGGDWKGSLLGGAAGGLFLYATARGYEKATGREGIGGGDINLIAMIGAFLGWKGVLLTIFIASFLGLLGALPAMAKGNKGLKTAIPFGPFLCAGALLSRFIAEAVWVWILGGR